MSEPTRFGPAIDYAHFFARVLQIGVDEDIKQCNAMLLSSYENEISRVRSKFRGRAEQLDTLRGVAVAEQGEEAVPQLERVAGLLLDIGADIPLLRLAGLLTVAADREPHADPWFVRRGIDEGLRLSYVRRLYTDDGSEGHMELLARTFALDPTELPGLLGRLLVPRLVEVDKDWAHMEGNIGPDSQVEIDGYWDGFISIDVRAGNAESFEALAAQLLQVVSTTVPRSIPNLGTALGQAVDREGSLRIRQL